MCARLQNAVLTEIRNGIEEHESRVLQHAELRRVATSSGSKDIDWYLDLLDGEDYFSMFNVWERS